MNRALQYFAMIKSGWVPNNINDTFYPFFNTIIYHYPDSKTMEVLSEKFKMYFGFSISHFILGYLIDKARRDGSLEINVNNSEIIIHKHKIDKTSIIDEHKVREQHDGIIELLSDFVRSSNEKEITLTIANEVLEKFLSRYDFDIITSNVDFAEDEADVFMYFFIEYVKSIYTNNPSLFSTLVSVCEGYMIKTMLLNEKIQTDKIYDGQLIFLDTPVVLQILGYYGEYLEKEYKFLVSSWIKQGAKVNVYDHTVLEINEILSTAERFVESSNIDISKSSRVLLYFREIGLSRSDVRMQIVKIKDLLKENEINIYDEDIKLEEKFIENENEIKNYIVTEYNFNSRYKKDYETASFIDYDVKSIFYTYLLRKNNHVTNISECKALFVTNNRGIVTAVNNYNIAHYRNSLSPVIRDTYIGMLVVANQLSKSTEYVSMNLISICSTAYKPTLSMREKYVKMVDELRNKIKISNEEYILLKNYPEVSDLISQKTIGFTETLTDDVIYKILDSIKAKMIDAEKRQMQIEIDLIAKEHADEISRLKAKAAEDKSLLENEKRNEKVKYALKEFKNYKKRVIFSYWIILVLLITANIYTWFSEIGPMMNDVNILFIAFSVLTVGYVIISIIENFYKKNWIISKCINRKKRKIALTYGLDIDELID